ncbi:hypothetical protein G7K_4975-t1 [Saitoella complicata NRRL Y-17804]|uniref:Polyadenylation factor subunit 2 n=2 Tax=Saitoella complicata (strain BCRC 22490 / CBS 7301 / JCM 7358 / NBRC 10748 / NRRL Y-17804) TaxID=698492 RepID=A0A0E9NMD3_SAICN|nr:hypothetical protein G7K_4975-t1 [Saitoella complicata NRRL Y-17804]
MNTTGGFRRHDDDPQLDRPPRKPMARRTVDYGSPVAKWWFEKCIRRSRTDSILLRPQENFIIDLLPPSAYGDNPADALPTKYIHTSSNKIKHPINVVKWTPEGRRLLTGSSSGEFTLWNGMAFNFETIMQAHDAAIRVAEWSHNGDWLLSGDHDGTLKYWQPNMNNLKVIQGHREAIRDLSFAPTDNKFVTASDDGTLKIWNFNEGIEERVLTGHGWDVKCVDWHSTKGLLVSGSKDNLVKLWDPRTAKCLTTLHGHKNTVAQAKFQPTRGDLIATCSRDQTCRIFDLRAMKDLRILRGHEKDVTSLTWHPVHASLISTGGSDGAINHYLLDETPSGKVVSATKPDLPATTAGTIANPTASIPFAHESSVWSLQYHPQGHILCSGSNDRATRFWARPRPGDESGFQDRYHVGEEAAEANGYGRAKNNRQEEDDEQDGLVDQAMPLPQQQSQSRISQPGAPMPANIVPGLGSIPLPPSAAGLPLPPPPPPGFLPPGFAASLSSIMPNGNGMQGQPPAQIPGFGLPGVRGAPLPSQQDALRAQSGSGSSSRRFDPYSRNDRP